MPALEAFWARHNGNKEHDPVLLHMERMPKFGQQQRTKVDWPGSAGISDDRHLCWGARMKLRDVVSGR